MNKKQVFAIGNDDFRDLITNGCYYVDKTLLIRDILQGHAEVTFFTRPRRFGKSLALSMLAHFFDVTKAEENKHLFDGLQISTETFTRTVDGAEKEFSYREEFQGKYPVVHLSMKEIEGRDCETAFTLLIQLLSSTFTRFKEPVLKKTVIEQDEADIVERILNKKATNTDIIFSLKILTNILARFYGQPVIVLLDEYDVPLRFAFLNHYYDMFMPVIRGMMSAVFKGNTSLKFGVITGCLRVAKESIFTGMNNLTVNTVLTRGEPEYFGFTQQEVDKLLDDCGLAGEREKVRSWYDGYLFGANEVYNPWSVVNFAKTGQNDPDGAYQPYWMNTSSNDILKRLIEVSEESETIRADIDNLIDGIPVEKWITENTVFADLESNPDLFWPMMLFTGYLKPAKPCGYSEDALPIPLVLPNHEVRRILKSSVESIFNARLGKVANPALVNALLTGDTRTAEIEINEFLETTISVRDQIEAFYHGTLLGLLRTKNRDFSLYSNSEQGLGYPDIVLLNRRKRIGIVLELKRAVISRTKGSEPAESWNQINSALNAALEEGKKQILEKRYDDGRLAYETDKVLCYSVAFYKKECRIRLVTIETDKPQV